MRGIAVIVALLALAGVAPAQAQQAEITLNADPVPIIEARINGHRARFEVDLRFGPAVMLNEAPANRMRVFPMGLGNLNVSLDGAARLRGRLTNLQLSIDGVPIKARPRIGVFETPVSTYAEGRISPSMLPHRRVTIVLGAELEGARDIVVPLVGDSWRPQVEIGGEPVWLEFDLSQPRSVINGVASRRFDGLGLINEDGPVTEMAFIPGVTMQVRPVRTELTALGLALAPAAIQTAEPLYGPEVIVVAPPAPLPPRVTLGRAALSRCASIAIDRDARQLTLRCAT